MWLWLLAGCFVSRERVLLLLDVDGDGYWPPEARSYGAEPPWDCAPLDPAVNPAATEVCNGLDDDCDDVVDPNCGELHIEADDWYDQETVANWTVSFDGTFDGPIAVSMESNLQDLSGLGGTGETSVWSMNTLLVPGDHLLTARATVNGVEHVATDTTHVVNADVDGDGYWSSVFGGEDCDDNNAEIHPEAEEVCDGGFDNDCNVNTVEDCSHVHCGALASNETWDAGVHQILCTVTVNNGRTLTLSPGAILKFEDDAGLRVGTESAGNLQANGNVEESVMFLPVGTDWAGFQVGPFGTANLVWAEVANSGINNNGLLTLEQVKFDAVEGVALAVWGGGVTIDGAEWTDGDTALRVVDTLVALNNSSFLQNDIGLECVGEGCLAPSSGGNAFLGQFVADISLESVFQEAQIPEDTEFSGGVIRLSESVIDVSTEAGLDLAGVTYRFDNGLDVYGGLSTQGVTVEIGEGKSLVVAGGSLNAEDTVFRPTVPEIGSWGGIIVQPGSDLSLESCDVGWAGPLLELYPQTMTSVMNTTIHDSDDYGIWCRGSCPSWVTQQMYNNTFYNLALGEYWVVE